MKILILLFLLAGQSKAATVSQLIESARILSYDQQAPVTQRLSYPQALELLNEAQRTMIAESRCLMQSMSFVLAAGTTYYSMPSNYVSIARVIRGRYGAITELSPAGLDGRSRGWESVNGTPVYYFTNFSSRGLVGFSPVPQTTSDTDTIKMDFYVAATDLVNPGDVPFNGVGELSQYQQGLAYYAAAVIDSIGGVTPKFQAYFGIYSGILNSMKARCMERPNYLPSAVAVP